MTKPILFAPCVATSHRSLRHAWGEALIIEVFTDPNAALDRCEDMQFGYRTSRMQKENLIVLEVKMRLREGNKDEIRSKMKELNRRRREKQPLNYPSSGSIFKRPAGHYAGKLIEDAGLKGYRIGGAQVSDKHCGFIINTGTATASDVIELIELVKRRVFETSGVILQQEVKILGG